jgi:hypothetical protein
MGDGRIDAEERRRAQLADEYDAETRERLRVWQLKVREESRDEEEPRESAQEAYVREQDDYFNGR